MSLRRAQNIFRPKNINSITINITLEGIEKIKRKLMVQCLALSHKTYMHFAIGHGATTRGFLVFTGTDSASASFFS